MSLVGEELSMLVIPYFYLFQTSSVAPAPLILKTPPKGKNPTSDGEQSDEFDEKIVSMVESFFNY